MTGSSLTIAELIEKGKQLLRNRDKKEAHEFASRYFPEIRDTEVTATAQRKQKEPKRPQ